MLSIRRTRGLFSTLRLDRLAALALATTLGSWANAAPASPSTAELHTYQRDNGSTYFALSLSPPEQAAAAEGRDIVILYDTSASQAGLYRETGLAALEACIARLQPKDRVQILAADLEARPITKDFLAADSAELKAAVAALRKETPLGSTDMEHVLRSVAARFEKARPAGRSIVYIGDGLSNANLLGTESFGDLVNTLTAARVSVSSYAIGPQCDARLLAALANHTGGNLYIDEPMERADEKRGVDEKRAEQENLRRGSTVGATLADWTHASVLWPAEVKWPESLGEVYPKTMPPLRTDRDTVVIGAASAKLERPIDIQAKFTGDHGPVELQWNAGPQAAGDGQAFLAQLVDLARADGGVTLPTVGSAGLAETGRMLEASVDGLTEFAERAVATGDVEAAQLAAKTVLQRDPGNVKAQTVQRVIEKKRTEAAPVAQVTTPAAEGGNDLNLVRQAQNLPLPPPPTGGAPAAQPELFPAEGSLTDRFAEPGELLDELQQNRNVYSQMLRRQVENTVIDARKTMSDDPATAIQDLKLALQNVERAPELTPEMRAALVDKLQIALREAQRESIIKDDLDAAREEQLAAARERRMLEDRLARDREREKQLVDRFSALIDERRFDEALDVAATIAEVDPEGVMPVVALVTGELRRNNYLQQVARAARWQNFFDTLYQNELSAIPFPDDPPIVYPAAPVWEDLTNRRKDRYGSMDLKATGESERRIESALRNPLRAAGLDYTEAPLQEIVQDLSQSYGIPIQLDETALEEIGLSRDEPVSVQLNNVSLQSALRIMLKKLNLTFVIRDEVLFITTEEEAERQLVVKVYPVADLVLPIDATTLGGAGGMSGMGGMGGGGMGGMGGGGMGGMGGGGMGGGMMGGGMGGGGFGGGGGGMFSVPADDGVPAVNSPATKPTQDQDKPQPAAAKPAASAPKPVAIAINANVPAEEFWNTYFSQQKADPAAVRETVRQLMGKRQLDQVIALINAALRQGHPQPWMYESLGIAMELAGKSKSEIERTVMSAADFSTSADELMYIAQYLTRLGLDRRAMLIYQQVVKIEPLRSEAYALGLRAAERSNDLAGVRWATVGILSQAWPTEFAEIEQTASRVARATLERLSEEGRTAEHEAYLKQLREAGVRDCLVRVSWTGEADIDVFVEEPGGTICSTAQPRTTSGGVKLGDEFVGDTANSTATETYVCPKGFAGNYRVRIRRVWGEVTANKVTVDVYTHVGTGETQHERRQIELEDNEALVAFDLNNGRRSEPLEAVQLAGAVKRQEAISRAVLAQQIESGSDPRVLPGRPLDPRGRFLVGGGAVGFQPILITLPEGITMTATGVVSADRRYVRIGVAPVFSLVPRVQTFTFAGASEETNGNNGGTTQ